jgi:NAD(P)H dehydrogenase (quinone)
MIVLTGANGRLGRLTALELAKRGMADQVRLTSRTPEKLEEFAQRGFKTVQADFGDAASLSAAFSGAQTVVMISMPGPIAERIPRHRACIDAARDAGVTRLVYTSRVNPAPDSLYPFAEIHDATEKAIAASGLSSTIMRNNEYIENILPAVEQAIESGKLVMPGATGRVAHVAVAEVAEALAIVATDDTHAGKVYEINGPKALSRADVADIATSIVGRNVTGTPPSAEEFADLRRAQGRPEFMVEMALGLFRAVDAGEFETVWPDLRNLLGRPPAGVGDIISQMGT